MLDSLPREKEWVSWCFVALWSFIIFVTVPAARSIQEFVSAHWGRQTFTYSVIVIIVITAAASMAHLRRVRLSSRNYVWLLMISAIFIGYTIALSANPEEALHFIEYGLIGFLIYRALSHRIRDVGVYFAAAAIGATVGITDEAIQWVTPGRFWSLKDIWLNFLAAALIQVAIAKGLQPAFITERLSPCSLRYACRLWAVAVALLGASLLNTPPRIASYTEWIGPLEFLRSNESMMAEYGYRHTDPEIGHFRSRFSMKQLKESDKKRAAEAADILDVFRGDRATYLRFLRTYTPVNDPFVHEARVHLFRRDRFIRRSEQVKDDVERCREYLTVAFRENRILEKYFANTFRRSSYVLPPDQMAFLKQNQQADYDYESAVSRRLVTSVSETQVMVALALVFLGLLLAARYYGQREKSTRVGVGS